MKKFVIVLAMFVGSLLFADGVAVKVAPPLMPKVTVGISTAPADLPAEDEPGLLYCLGRGVSNIGTGWLEIPRCMVYDIGENPWLGFFIAIPEGVGLTICRTLCGVTDVLMLGTTGYFCHDENFPDFVFQSKWIYREAK